MSATLVTSPRRAFAGADPFAGTGRLVRFILRRDRVRLPVWLASISVVVLGSVASFSSTYPNAADLAKRGRLVQSNAAAQLFTGPGYGLDHYTYGAMTANELLPMAAIAVALMNIFLVVRHTRTDEEAGRLELVRAAGVGRYASITATFLVVAAADALLGLILAFGLPASLDGLDARGSVALAAALVGVGLVFAGVGLVAAQLTVGARAALGLAVVVTSALYLLRAAADIVGSPVTWVSPFAWATEIRAYVDERWWPLALSVLLTAALIVVATSVGARRDLGAGVLAEGRGPAHAARWLGTPVGLAFRLQRSVFLGWAVPLFLLAALYASIAAQASNFYQDVDALKDYLSRAGAADAADQFLTISIQMMAMIASGFAISAVGRLRTEEASSRADTVLATPVSRTSLLVSHLLIALGGSALLLLLVGLGAGLGRVLTGGQTSEILGLVCAALAYVPAAWAYGGLAVLLFGVLPRAVALAWLALAGTLLIGFLGPLVKLPARAYDVSPFQHSPNLPAGDVSALPLVLLLVVGLAFVACGLVAFRNRDIAS